MLISKYKTKDIKKQLEKYEEALGCTFPAQYRQFMLTFNGGKTRKTTLNISKYENSIEYFYGFVKVDECYSINNKYVKEIQRDFLTRQQVLGIAYLGGGDILCVGIGNGNNGEMFYSNHDEGYKVTKIASSFKELLDKIESKPIDKDTLEHPDDLIKRMCIQNDATPEELPIDIYWQQYNDLLNLEQEEVVISD